MEKNLHTSKLKTVCGENVRFGSPSEEWLRSVGEWRFVENQDEDSAVNFRNRIRDGLAGMQERN